MSWRERYVVTNGIRLFAVESGPRRGPLVLLLHGWPECWWSWRHQLPVLGDAGYHTVAIDLPGFGRSDKPDVSYDEEWVTTTIAGAVAALGHEQVVIAGHDWGGLVVWPFARRFPDRTAGVIGLNTPDLPHGHMSVIELLRMAFPDNPPYIIQFQEYGPAEYMLGRNRVAVESWLRFVYQGATTKNADAFSPDDIAVYIDQFAPEGAVTTSIAYYRSMHRNWELRKSLPEIVDAPALMICAADDPVLTPAMAEGMEERVPRVHKVVIDDCGHWTQQERPAETNAHMLAFLDGLERGRNVTVTLPKGEAKTLAVRGMFDAIAPRYDLVNRIMTFGMDVVWRRRAVAALSLPERSRVLDVACGTGDLCRELERAGHRPIGIDLSSGMLSCARTSAPLVHGDELCLPFDDESFDGVVSGFALRNVTDLDALFCEMARVVRPGGRVALLEVAEPSNQFLHWGHALYFGRVVPHIGGLLSDAAAYRYLPASVAYLPPPFELMSMFERAGFTAVKRTLLSYGIAQRLTGTGSR